MTRIRNHRTPAGRVTTMAMASVLAGCGGGSGPLPPDPAPTVSGASPLTSFRGTTIEVRVTGANFQPDSRVVWRRNGTTDTAYATTRVRTNATTFVSAAELLVSTTIEPDARLGRYDLIVVTAGSKAGVGSELFALRLDIQEVDLGAGDQSEASSVNAQGQIVGTRTVGGVQRAFLWQNGTLTDLGLLPGMTYSQASDINDAGQVVGFSGLGTVESAASQRAFTWSATGGLQPLSTLGGPVTYAHAISETGDIAGGGVAGDGARHGAVWRAGIILDIEPGPNAGTSGTWDLNRHAEVAGWRDSRAARWTAAGGLEDLAFGAGTAFVVGNALGINDAGQIVGWRRFPGPSPREAFLHSGSSTVNLLAPVGLEGIAWAINNRGQVVGSATMGTQTAAFLWTALDGLTMFGVGPGVDATALGLSETGWVVGIRANRATLWKVK